MPTRELPSQGMELGVIAKAMQDLVELSKSRDPVAIRLQEINETLQNIDESLKQIVKGEI